MSSDQIDESLPKPITKMARAYASFIATNMKAKEAINPDTIFLVGRCLLDKGEFNRVNDGECSVFHGAQVFYGPFSTKSAAQEFVSEYDLEWPGDNDWKYIHPGQVDLLTPYFDPGMADVVHNASLEFQGQAVLREQERRIKEIEQVQDRISKRQDSAVKGDTRLSHNEIDQNILWQEQKIKQAEKQLGQLLTHLDQLKRLRD